MGSSTTSRSLAHVRERAGLLRGFDSHTHGFKAGLWGMESTSVIQQKGLPKDYFDTRKGDSLVSQKWGETP